MGLQLDLEQDVATNLKNNNVVMPTGAARRRRRGGVDGDESAAPPSDTTPATPTEIEAAKPVAKYAITKVMTTAYGAMKKGLYAATAAGAAAAVIYAVDQSFRPDLCDPMAKSFASALSVVPMANMYVMKCENAMTVYNNAMTTAFATVAGLLVTAFRSSASIVVDDDVIDDVAETIVEAAKNPTAVAAKAMTARSKAKTSSASESSAVEDVRPRTGRRGGKRKTKKQSTKRRRSTRRSLFKY